MKITMLSDELRAGHFARLGLWLSLFVAIFTGDFFLIGVNDRLEVIAFVIVLTVGLLFVYREVVQEASHYRRQISEIDPLLRTVELGTPIGDYNELVRKFREI